MDYTSPSPLFTVIALPHQALFYRALQPSTLKTLGSEDPLVQKLSFLSSDRRGLCGVHLSETHLDPTKQDQKGSSNCATSSEQGTLVSIARKNIFSLG